MRKLGFFKSNQNRILESPQIELYFFNSMQLLWHFGKHLFAAVNIQKSPTTKAVEEIIFVPYSFRIWVENNTGNGSLFPGRNCPSKIRYQINRIMFCNKLSLEATD